MQSFCQIAKFLDAALIPDNPFKDLPIWPREDAARLRLAVSMEAIFSIPLAALVKSAVPTDFIFVIAEANRFTPLAMPVIEPVFTAPSDADNRPNLLHKLSMALLAVFACAPILISRLSIFANHFTNFRIKIDGNHNGCRLYIFSDVLCQN